MSRALNPYHYGSPAIADNFAGRQTEIATVSRCIRGGANVVLTSPRRYGKTSLLIRVAEDLDARRPAAAIVAANVLRARDLASLAERLVSSLYRVPGARWHKSRHPVPQFLRHLSATPSVRFEKDGTPSFRFAGDLGGDGADELIADVFGALAELAQRRPAALVLDECQSMLDQGAQLPGLLDRLADKHPKVSIVLAGSRGPLMDGLAGENRTLGHDATERLELGPIPEEVMVEHLCRRAAIGRKSLRAAVASEMVRIAGPAPSDIQRLAYEAYDASPGAIDASVARRAMAAAVAHGTAAFAEQFGRLAPGQRRVLSELAVEPCRSPYAATFVNRVKLANGASVRKALLALVESEIVVERDGRYEVADQFFASWLCEGASSWPH